MFFDFWHSNKPGVHFVYVHFFNKAKNYCICPLCNFQTLNIINHVIQTHPKHCYYCTKKWLNFPHTQTAKFLLIMQWTNMFLCCFQMYQCVGRLSLNKNTKLSTSSWSHFIVVIVNFRFTLTGEWLCII